MRNSAKIISMLEARGFSFSFFIKDDEAAHAAFVAKHWPRAITRRNYGYIKWKYGVRADGSLNLLLCKKDGIVVGQIGYVPARLRVNGTTYDVVWGCNFKVEDAFRELGIGAALEMYASGIFPIILGNTPSVDSIKYKRSLGYKMLQGPRTMMFAVRVDHLLKLKGAKLPGAVIQVAAAFANPVLTTYNKLRLSAAINYWTEVSEEEVAKRIAIKENSIHIPHIIHDEAFLQWRVNLPAGLRDKAKMFVANEGDSYVISSISGKVLNIYDFSFASSQLLRSFLKQAVTIEGINTLRIQANTGGDEILLRKAGFIPFRSKAVITAYSRDRIFEGFDKMYVTGFDGDIDL